MNYVKENWIPFSIGGGVLFIISILLWMGFSTDPKPAYVQDKSWVRTQDVEEYRWVQDSDTSRMFYPSAPTGARNVSHSHWMTQDHHPRQTHTETYYTGSGEDRRSHTRTVVDREAWVETINNYRTSYEIQRWVFDRRLTAQGGVNEEPIYPIATEDATHRLANPTQTYNFVLRLENAKHELKNFTTSDFNTYKGARQEEGFVAYINKFGAVLQIKRFDGSEVAMAGK